MQSRSTAPYTVVVIGIVIACGLMGLCVLQLLQSRDDALDRARETSRNLGLVAERDIERNVELYDLSLQVVLHGLQRTDVMNSSASLRRAVLFDHAMTAQFLGSMLVLDAGGNIVLDSANDVPRQGNYSDRKYFTAHRDNPNVGLYVSDPFASRLRGGSLSMVLSQQVSNPDGSFGGVALIAINVEYFRQLFAGLSLGQHGSMSLIGNDGITVMRHPYDVHVIGGNISKAATFRRFQTAPEGSFSETASIDGVRRLYYFKHLPKLPLIIMVAEAEQDIYAGWWHRAVTIGALVATFGVAFVIVSVMLGMQLRRRMRAESEQILLARTDGLTGLNNRRASGNAGPRMALRPPGSFRFLPAVCRRRPFQGVQGHVRPSGGRRRAGGCCSLHRREHLPPGRYRGSLRWGRIRRAVARYAANGCRANRRAHSCGHR